MFQRYSCNYCSYREINLKSGHGYLVQSIDLGQIHGSAYRGILYTYGPSNSYIQDAKSKKNLPNEQTNKQANTPNKQTNTQPTKNN